LTSIDSYNLLYLLLIPHCIKYQPLAELLRQAAVEDFSNLTLIEYIGSRFPIKKTQTVMLRTTSYSRPDKKRNPSLLKVFKKGGKDAETTNTAPNTPEEETGVTVVANEVDPSHELLSPLTLQQVPSPLRGDDVSNFTKSSAVREEKKEDPSVPGDQTVEDVVSKTLNFFDDMCAIPQIPQISSDHGVESIAASSIKKYPHLAIQESSYTGAAASDDNTTSPSLPSVTTANSSVDPSTRYSNSYVSSYNNKLSNKTGDNATTAHDHENFEVVLDPASMTKEEKMKSMKPNRGKRWNRISKSLASSLSSPSLKKEKNQSVKGGTRNDENSGYQKSGSNKTSSIELKEPPTLTQDEFDDAPLDEEIGRLIGINESDQHHHEGDCPENNKHKDSKTSTSVGGPKVLAKKIWKNCKKIPITARHKGEVNQQSHRAEVDSEAAVARSLEANSSLEEQEFLQLGCPKQDVEPILEENESEDDADFDGTNELNSKDKEQRSSMAKAWNNIFASVTNTLDPEMSAEKSSNAIKTKSHANNISEPLSTNLLEEQNDLQNEEVLVPEGQSVEVSSGHANKKTPQRRTASLGGRLKKIQKSAYFKSSRKGAKNNKVSDPSKAENGASGNSTVAEYSVASPGGVTTEKFSASSTELLKKPKVVWKSVVDSNSGRTYYYHRKTRETTWTKPEALKRYEVANKKWLDATVGASSANETERKQEGETKDEERASTASIRSASWPKTASSKDAERNGKANTTDILRTSTPPVEKNSMTPLQMSDSLIRETKKQGSSTVREDVVIRSNNEENGAEKETKVRPEKTKQPFDESKPFDESTPFDEPLADNGPGLLFLPRSPARFGRTMTYMSKASARSALTDRTEKIRNTGKGKLSSINPINENSSTATSISSFHDVERYNLGRGATPAYRVPSRVPVHRERQLMVEELTDARLSAESYEGNAGEKRGRIVRGRAREIEPAPEVLYDGDNETLDDYGASTFDNDTYGTDSVSALSENDTDFLSRRDNFDQARRRALDAAIEIEDWDLAAALSDGMRAVNLPGGYEKAHSSWNQSELDKFIANNDWNAVKSYIARMREQSKKEQGNGASSGKGQAASANKRVGSRSQIQHREMMSESSWSGSDSQSSYETYDSESEI